jgi:tetratricopeptide (TPR) repeat protein
VASKKVSLVKVILLVLGLLVVPGLLGLGVYWQRRHSLGYQLATAQAGVGTRQGGQLLEKLARAYPEAPAVQFLRARHLRLAGNNDLAQAALKRAAELGWPGPEVERERELVLAQADFRRVEPKLQARLDADPHDRGVLLALAQGYDRLRQLTKAESLANRLLQEEPQDKAALALRGQIRLRAQRPGEARQDLEAALGGDPDQYYCPSARVCLAGCLFDLGRFEDCLALCRRCQVEQPNNPVVFYGTGQCALYLNRLEEAQEAFEAALRLQPHHLDSLLQLAWVQEQRGNFPKALELLEKVEGQDPDRHDVHFCMAKILQAMGQTERAATYKKRYDALTARWAADPSGRRPGKTRDERDAPASMGRFEAK